MNRRQWLTAAMGASLAACAKADDRSADWPEAADAGTNPERGFYTQAAAEEATDFAAIRRAGSSLVLLTLNLHKHRDRALTQAKLERLDLALTAVREAGLKVVFRAAYGFTDLDYRVDPADLGLIRDHIGRLGAVLSRHAPVVWAVQAGMLGPWGEWHGSTHGDPPSAVARRGVVDAWLAALPPTTFVQVRRPQFVRDLAPSPAPPAQARIGWHDDAMLAMPDDMGTYGAAGWSRAQELAWSHHQAQLTPFGGETVPASESTAPDQVMREFKLLRISFLNRGYHPGTLNRWRQLNLAGNPLFAAVDKRLGYRWLLRRLQVPRGGGRIALELENVGFAPIYSTRRLEATWLDPNSLRPLVPAVATGLDLQGHCPEAGRLSTSFDLPAMPPAAHLGLRFADPALPLREDGRYAIRLMNAGLRFHQPSGWNYLP